MLDKKQIEQLENARKQFEKLNIPKDSISAIQEFQKKYGSAFQNARKLKATYEPLLRQAELISNIQASISRIQGNSVSHETKSVAVQKPNVTESLKLDPKILESIRRNPTLDAIKELTTSIQNSHREEAEIFKNLLELNQLQFESNKKDSKTTKKLMIWTLIATSIIPLFLKLLEL